MRNDNHNPIYSRNHGGAARLRSLGLAGLLAAAVPGAAGAQSPAMAARDALAAKSDAFVSARMRYNAKPAKAGHPAGPAKSQAIWGATGVIIRTNRVMTPEQEQQLQAAGASVYRHLPFIQSVAARVSMRDLPRIASLPFVARISADAAIRKCDEFTVGSSGAAVAMQQYGVNGSGITVAVVDSGVYGQHPDLSTGARLLASADFVGDGTNLADPCGHGTHVAGIIAGNGAASTGSQYFRTFYGIARNANLVSARVLDANGQSNVSTVLAGIQWVINNRAQYNIRVMNLSLGHPVGESYTTDPLCQAVEAAWKSGIFVVCAAGNAGRLNAAQTPGSDNEGWGTANGSIQSPANDPFVITVGAMKSVDGNRAHDQIATYSSRGPSRLDMVMKPDIVAPGNRVISLDSKGSCLDTAYGVTNVVPMSAYKYTSTTVASWRYFRLSGTSMAAPVVAGAAALMLQKDPTLTPDMLKARLMISADKWADMNGNFKPCTYGAGYLNIPAALASTARISAYATSPTLSRDSQGNVVINRQFVIWGTSTIWGLDTSSTTTTTTDPSGGTTGGTTTDPSSGTTTPPPPDNIIIWGNNIIWGSDTLSASNIIWGSSVWSDNIIWGSSASSVDLSTTALLGE